jgi:hypothetical protein
LKFWEQRTSFYSWSSAFMPCCFYLFSFWTTEQLLFALRLFLTIYFISAPLARKQQAEARHRFRDQSFKSCIKGILQLKCDGKLMSSVLSVALSRQDKTLRQKPPSHFAVLNNANYEFLIMVFHFKINTDISDIHF